MRKLVSAYDGAKRAYENAVDEVGKLDDEERRLSAEPVAMGEELSRDRHLGRIEKGRTRIDSWFRMVAHDWVEAMRILRHATMGKEERTNFDEDLRKIEDRLRSADVIEKLG